ncbi:MAG: aldehyde dehydrogenase family protein [Rhodopseudomonas palustris]|nr:aldehyde dehydrogenase family protein [Rhodopseudomonas palustris]
MRIANDTPYGLVGLCVGRYRSSAPRKVARQIRAGNVQPAGRVPIERAAPFGGYKQSGNGREWGDVRPGRVSSRSRRSPASTPLSHVLWPRACGLVILAP